MEQHTDNLTRTRPCKHCGLDFTFAHAGRGRPREVCDECRATSRHKARTRHRRDLRDAQPLIDYYEWIEENTGAGHHQLYDWWDSDEDEAAMLADIQRTGMIQSHAPLTETGPEIEMLARLARMPDAEPPPLKQPDKRSLRPFRPGQRKLTDEQATLARERQIDGMTLPELSAQLGVSQSALTSAWQRLGLLPGRKRKPIRLTDGDARAARELWDEGEGTVEELAGMLEVTVNALNTRWRELRLTGRPGPRRGRRYPPALTETALADLHARYVAGERTDDLARETGRTGQSLRAAWRKRGWFIKPRGVMPWERGSNESDSHT